MYGLALVTPSVSNSGSGPLGATIWLSPSFGTVLAALIPADANDSRTFE